MQFFWHQDWVSLFRVNFGYKNDGFILSKIVHSAPPGLKALIQDKVQKKICEAFFWSKNLVITYYFVVDVVIVLALHLKNLSDI